VSSRSVLSKLSLVTFNDFQVAAIIICDSRKSLALAVDWSRQNLDKTQNYPETNYYRGYFKII